MTDHLNSVGSRICEGLGRAVSASKILVVDDDTDTRELLRALFERCSYEVEEAQDSHEALEKIQSWEPDLVTTDVARPDSTGLDLLRLVKARRPGLPVVFVTHRGDYRGRCMAEGATGFIELPFEPEELVTVVSKALSMTKRDEGES